MKSKLNKILSVFLSCVLVLGVCFCAVGVKATSKEITYYVSANGSESNGGLSLSDSLLTISKAIQKANAENFGSGDTVYVNLVNYDAINWGTAVSYDFDLVVRSNDESLRNTISISSGFTFGGDTAFQNVIVKNISKIFYGNYNVSFDNNCTFNSSDHYIGSNKVQTAQTVNKSQTVYMGSTVVSKNFVITDASATDKTYAKDVTVVFADEKSTPTVSLSATTGNTIFADDLSFNVMRSKSISFQNGGGKSKVNGAVQFIVNSATSVSEESLTALKSISTNENFYHIVNASGVDDLINVTETAGQYEVNTDRYQVIATSEDGSQYIAKDGILTLPKAGYYVVRTVKIIETATYYVSASGSDENDGKTSSTSVATIARAVELANEAGYLAGDLITVNVAGSSSILSSVSVNLGSLPRYYFDLLVQSNATSSYRQPKIIFETGNPWANNQDGTTYYKNVKLSISETWKSANFSSANVVMDSSVSISGSYLTLSYGTGNDGGASKKIASQRVELNCNIPYAISLTNSTWSGRTYTDDVELVLNNSNLNANVLFNSYWSNARSGNTRYEKNVNINLKTAKGVRFKQFDGATFGGAIQVINSAGIDFDKKYTTSADTDPLTANQSLENAKAEKYIINNKTGNKDIISFTKTAGKFAVDTGKYKVTATDGVNTYTSTDGYLVLETAGVYTLTLNHTHSYSNDCDESCNSCGDIRTNAHVYTNECDAQCDVCSYVRNNNHVYDHGCDKTCNVCYMSRTTSHIYKGDCDEDCDVCGEIRTATDHIFTNDCDVNCDVCGFERTVLHTYDNDCDKVCNICGFERIPLDHVYYNSCDTTCDACGSIRAVEHIFDSVCDKQCNKCNYTRKSSHAYDNSCDAYCNICGFKRTVIHTYTDVCDSDCNICGDQRKSHIYDSDCDTVCNLCNNERTVSNHIYDSFCDENCNVCGFVRAAEHSLYEKYIANQDSHWKQCEVCGYKHQLTEHNFDGNCDKKCEDCGYIRSIYGHIFDSDCDSTCNDCDYVRNTGHKYSSVCDSVCDVCGFVREAEHVGGTATCKTRAVCQSCGVEYGEKDGKHTGEIRYRDSVAAKCNKDGYTGEGYCMDCNKLAIPGKVIPATKLHRYNNECDKSCNVCGDMRDIKHQFSPATCTEAEKCYICGITGKAKLGHRYVVNYEKANFVSNGRAWEECSECGLTQNERTLIQIASIEIADSVVVYDGKVKTAEFIVKDTNGDIISNEYYEIKCNTIKNVGRYIVTVNFKNGYSGKYTTEFFVMPQSTTISNIKTSGTTIKVSINTLSSDLTGYIIEYSTNSDFRNSNIKTTKTQTTEIKELGSGKTYYVRVRTYKVVGAEKIYSDWSDSVKVAIK